MLTCYNFTHGNDDPARKLGVYFNIKTIVRGYHAYQSEWVAVGKKLPCKREQANSKDPFTVVVTTSKLSVGSENFRVCLMLQRQHGSIFSQVTGSAAWQQCAWLPQLIAAKKFLEEEIFVGMNFFASWCLIMKIMKISCYTVCLSEIKLFLAT